ncbi:hypothetical protein MMC30_002014 [Trapelia coarctata]|nr:hypothetical protein [Trapelia coarctata]
MSQSDGSTDCCTPEDFADDVNVNEEGVFAWLRPFNQDACDAFDATVNAVIKNSDIFEHFRQFLHLEGKKVQRAGSVFTEDEDDNNAKKLGENEQWRGAFKFSLESPRNDPTSWRLGSQCSPDRIDILLAPGDRWKRLKVAHSHARLYIHRESYRMILEARHTVTIGRNCPKPITNLNSQVLEDGELVIIGACTFIFEHTEFFTTPTFQTSLQQVLNGQGSGSLNQYLSPTSVGVPVLLGNYFCSPSAFAQGTFGTVSAGWTRDGAAVAIKRFKKPSKAEVLAHRAIMDFIGSHGNILQLLECVYHFETPIPDAYCVYSPLAAGSLRDVVTYHKIDTYAQLALFTDYLRGLSYLHNQKGVMHRDINPNNLAVVSLDDPRGIIIDLDSATQSPTSKDHMRGTPAYLAPEIVDLKDGRKVPPFDKSADIWALGLSMFDLYQGCFLLWAQLPPGEKLAMGTEPPRNTVTDDRYTRFQRRIQEMKDLCKDPIALKFIGQIESMTEYSSKDRMSASDLLEEVLPLTTPLRQGKIVLKGLATKRPREE